MSMICGNWNRRAGKAKGLNGLLAALPGHEADGQASWAGASVAFGWRGRACGEEGADSPRLDAASGTAITASVRLDGRAALCEALSIPHPDRSGVPDSVLILKAYARWGRACPEHLLGDFAFTIWDAQRELLFSARDHIGTRPFYYAFAGDNFVFGSDIAAVLAAPGVSNELDEAAIATRLTRRTRLLGPRTCYRAVRRLPPGHVLSVERGAARLHRWWRPEEVPPLPPTSDGALAEECLAIVTEAVRDRVRDGRHIGVHVSGLDSSSVAVLAARELRRQGRPAPPAFSWFPPRNSGSRAAAGEYGAFDPVCRQEGLQLFCWPPEPRDIVAFLRRDGFRESDTMVHEEMVRRGAAEKGVEVLLSGWGGDEGISFNGRRYYCQLLRSGRLTRLWRELRERSRNPLAAFVWEALLPMAPPRAGRAARTLRRGEWPFRTRATFVHPGFARRVRLLPAEGRPRGGVRDVQVHLLRSGRLSYRMEGWNASGARHRIEYRYPLLDRRVLAFALGLPPEQYRRGRWSRWLLRRALDPVLPPEVCWNPSKRNEGNFESVHAALAAAAVSVRRMIEERAGPLSRARYLDLPLLLEGLDPERWCNARGRTRKRILNALHFLDF